MITIFIFESKKMLVTGFWSLAAGYWLLDTGCSMLDEMAHGSGLTAQGVGHK
jgi:hypothetical protein